MPSQAFAGYHGKVYVSSDGGTTYNPIGEVREATLTISTEEMDVTSFDFNGWVQNIAGLRSWEMSAEGFFVSGNAGQTAIKSAVLNGDIVRLRMLPRVGSGNEGFQGDAIITNFEVTNGVEDAVGLSAEFMGAGELTTYTAA